MYVRTTKSGGHEYLQLAHNERSQASGQTTARVIYKFGRKDQLDVEAIRRLAGSLSRFLEPEEAEQVRAEAGLASPFTFLGAKHVGGTHLLDGVWRRLNIDGVLKKLLKERDFKVPVERLLFALVARRALAPDSKLALESWLQDEVHIDGLAKVDVQQLYRAMDFLLEAHDDIQREVFWSVRNLFNLEIDLILVDTTTTYFEIEGEDQDEEIDDQGDNSEPGLRKRGHSKDSRPDLAQVVIGFAVTRSGIPVRCWVWPGNSVDVKLVEEVKRDLNEWKLSRVVLALDTGFNSEANRKTLQGAGDAYILGERMRLGPNGTLPEPLRRAGRYKTLASGLRIKEVLTNPGSVTAPRFVVVHNPEQEERDRTKREDIIAETERRLAQLGDLTGKEHTKVVCDLRSHRVFGGYLRQLKNGKLVINKSKVATEAKLDGKYLISSSDADLSAEDLVAGYKQLHEIERVNRDLKHSVDVRPVYHHRSDRIKAHVLLCWLALLLIRIAETETGHTWHQLKKVMRPLMLGLHDTEHGPFTQTSKLKPEQKSVLDALRVKPPARYPDLPGPKKPKNL